MADGGRGTVKEKEVARTRAPLLACLFITVHRPPSAVHRERRR